MPTLRIRASPLAHPITHLVYFAVVEHDEVPAEALLLSNGLLADQTLLRGRFRVLVEALRVHSALVLQLHILPRKLVFLRRDGLGALQAFLRVLGVVRSPALG